MMTKLYTTVVEFARNMQHQQDNLVHELTSSRRSEESFRQLITRVDRQE